MKFSMSSAWNDAMAMFTANREVLLALSGIFFFLPNLVMFVAIPGLRDMQQQIMLNPEAGQAQMEAVLMDHWPALLAGGLFFMLFMLTGYLALVTMLRDHPRPTVAEAIRFGAAGSIPALGASILAYLAIVVAVLIPVLLIAVALGGLLSAVGMAESGVGTLAGVIAAMVGMTAAFYAMTKLSLFIAVMGLEPTFRPLHALRQSWRLTKGNSFRIFVFYALLGIVYLVIAIAVSMPLALLASLGTVGLFVNALVSGALSAVVAALYATILAAIHRQLVGRTATGAADFI